MKITQAALAALAGLTILAAAACGTDNNSTASNDGGNTANESVAPAANGNSTSASGAPSSDTSAADSSDASAPGSAFDAAGFTCATGTLRSSGSTAQGKVMAELITSYNAKCGATIGDYGGGGSGKGVTDFLSGQTDFGGSDSAMKEEDLAHDQRCEGNNAVNLPMVTGPIAVVFHLTGVDRLVLTPDVLSGIFGNEITNWNDKAIAAINPGVTLPDLAIATVHRSEDSGTTDNFTKYLAAAGSWKFEGGKAWTAPGGVGAQGSDGVAKAVADTEGAIGYVEWGFAQQENLAMAEIDNGSGPVALTAESAGKAVAAAEIVGKDGDLALKLDYATSEAGAYPVILVTYELICTGGNGDKADLLKSFLGYAVTDGQALFAGLGAAPLPESIRTQVETTVKAIA